MKRLLAILILLTATTQAQDTPQTRMRLIAPAETEVAWTWTQPAEHHGAVVRVAVPGGAGSGIMVDHGGPGTMILTAAHVLGGYGSATMTSIRTGNNFQANVLYKNAGNDVAVLHAPTARPRVTLGVGNFIPAKGDTIEVTGLGGPASKLRHFSGTFLGQRKYDSGLDFNCDVISGDSGSAIVYKGKAVVGLVRGGSRLYCRHCERSVTVSNGQAICPVHGVTDSPLNRPTQSDVSTTTLASIVKTVCQQRGWQPLILDQQCQPCQPMQNNPNQGGGGLYPPDIPLVPPANPRPTEPTPGGCCGKDGKDGIDGTDGPPGPAGAQGVPGKDAYLTDEEREELRLSILADLRSYIAGNPDFKGDPGDSGAVDPVELAARIQPHLDPIYPKWVYPPDHERAGQTISEKIGGVRLGEQFPMSMSSRVIDAGR